MQSSSSSINTSSISDYFQNAQEFDISHIKSDDAKVQELHTIQQKNKIVYDISIDQTKNNMFKAKLSFNGCIYFALSSTKKTAEKILRTWLYDKLVNTVEDNRVDFFEFKKVFSSVEKNSKVILIDMETAAADIYKNNIFLQFLEDSTIKKFCVIRKNKIELKGAYYISYEKPKQKDLIEQSIIRLFSYLFDSKEVKTILLISKNAYYQRFIENFKETGQYLLLCQDEEHFESIAKQFLE